MISAHLSKDGNMLVLSYRLYHCKLFDIKQWSTFLKLNFVSSLQILLIFRILGWELCLLIAFSHWVICLHIAIGHAWFTNQKSRSANDLTNLKARGVSLHHLMEELNLGEPYALPWLALGSRRFKHHTVNGCQVHKCTNDKSLVYMVVMSFAAKSPE